MNIVEKTKRQIKQLEEKVSLTPNISTSTQNASKKKSDVEIDVDTSDERNLSNENSNIFSSFNSRVDASALRVDVKIDEDIEEESSDSIYEGGEDTVYGQGTNPKPEDETYLNLLKGAAPKPKKIVIKPS